MNEHPTAAPAEEERSIATLRRARRPRRTARRRVRERQHDERFDPLRTLARRRALVVVGYLLAVTAAFLELRLDGLRLAGTIPALVFLAGMGLVYVLHRTVRNTIDAPDEALDERLIAVRDSAYRTAYTMLVWPTLAVLFAVMIAAGPDSVTLEPRHLQALVWAFALVVALTPSAVLAWRERQV